MKTERTEWSRAYFAVAVLAAVLVPLAAATAVWSTVASRSILNQAGIDDSHRGVASLGTRGFAVLGAVCGAVVVVAGHWRHAAAATAVVAVALVVYMALCMLGVFDAWTPLIVDIRGLK